MGELEALETNFAPLEVVTGTTSIIMCRAFDSTTREYVNGIIPVPTNMASGNVTFTAWVMAKTAVASKNVRLSVEIQNKATAATYDASYTEVADSDKAIDATQGNLTKITWTTSTSNFTAGNMTFFRLSRVNSGVSGNLAGDMYLVLFNITFP